MNPQVIAETMGSYFKWWSSRYSEKIYGFVFYSTSMLSYAGCTVFTEEGLQCVSGGYFAEDNDESIDLSTNELRWSPCDSPHHMENDEIFEHLNTELRRRSKELYELDDLAFEKEIEKEYESILQGIRDFRNKHTPPLNERILVTMMWGDISMDEQLRFVRSCNSEALARKFFEENYT